MAGVAVDWLDAFDRDEQRRHLSKATIVSRHRTLSDFLNYCDPASCGREDVERWLDSRRLTARSRATYISTLRAFFTYVIDTDRRADDPLRGIHPPRTTRLVPRPIRDDDLAYAIRHADPRMRAWLMLGAYQGFRAVEIAGLLRQDVLDDADPPMLIVSQGKGSRQRILPLHPDTESALRVYGLPAAGLIFQLRRGGPLRAQTVSAYIGRYLRRLSIKASGHQTRHWFGTHVYAESEHDLRLTQELLGHASPQTTAGYAAYSPKAAGTVIRSLHVGRSDAPTLWDA